MPLAEFFWLYRRFLDQKKKEQQEQDMGGMMEMPSNPALADFLKSGGLRP